MSISRMELHEPYMDKKIRERRRRIVEIRIEIFENGIKDELFEFEIPVHLLPKKTMKPHQLPNCDKKHSKCWIWS